MHLGLLPLLIRQIQPFRVDVFNRINSADRTISEHFTDTNLLILSFLDEIHELQIFVPRRCGSKHRIMFIRLLFICRSTSFLCHANRSRELYASPKQHQNSTRKLAKNPAQSAPDNKLWTRISFQKWISRYKEHILSQQTHPRVVNQRETSPLFAMNFNVFALQVHPAPLECAWHWLVASFTWSICRLAGTRWVKPQNIQTLDSISDSFKWSFVTWLGMVHGTSQVML